LIIAVPKTRRIDESKKRQESEISLGNWANALIELERSDNLISRNGIDNKTSLIGQDDSPFLAFQGDNSVINFHDAINKRKLEAKARIQDDTNRLTKAEEEYLLGLVHNKKSSLAQGFSPE
jgi:hypothetical protein